MKSKSPLSEPAMPLSNRITMREFLEMVTPATTSSDDTDESAHNSFSKGQGTQSPQRSSKQSSLRPRLRYTTNYTLQLVRGDSTDFIIAVRNAKLSKRPVHLKLSSYDNNTDIIAACLWFALDHGVKVIVTASDKPPKQVPQFKIVRRANRTKADAQNGDQRKTDE